MANEEVTVSITLELTTTITKDEALQLLHENGGEFTSAACFKSFGELLTHLEENTKVKEYKLRGAFTDNLPDDDESLD